MSEFSNLLLNWYSKNARVMPWRGLKDPYAIWISEIMLQQTKVETVIPYFNKWMKTFPDVKKLANASEEEVLLAWEGLGYYRRAINLSRTAKIIVEDYEGLIPDNINLLRSLPGIGEYTSSAIASIAFNKDTPTIDGNIRRIICRVFDISESIDLPTTEKEIMGNLIDVKPSVNVGDFNQALMDLGATLCKPRNPECSLCPIQSICISKKLNIQSERPVIKKRPAIPTYYFVCALINKENEILLVKRKDEKLLGGLWEFPNEKLEGDGTDQIGVLKNMCKKKLGMRIKVDQDLGLFNHTYTHFKQVMHAFKCDLIKETPDLEVIHSWVDINEFSNYPMGKISKKIIQEMKINRK